MPVVQLRRACDSAVVTAYVEHADLLKSVAKSYVREAAVAEDIVHDVVAKVLEANFSITAPKSYFIAAVKNRAINHVVSAGRRGVIDADDSVLAKVHSTEPLPDMALEGKGKMKAFMLAYDKLPRQCRRVLSLNKMQGLSLQETADELGLARSTVQKHLAKALARCEADMAASGYVAGHSE